MGTKLQVLICTYGAEGILRTAASRHPKTEGVEYLVSWQTEGGTPLPEELRREDFVIFRTNTKGLSKNRNHSIEKSSAPLLLFSDDDVDYTEEWLKTVIRSFEERPECDILTFKYESDSHEKIYPAVEFNLRNPAKGYYPTSFEIACRKSSLKNGVRFNENFGIGALFSSGEEDIFIYDCLSAGLEGRFIPELIARHEGDTTSEREQGSATQPQTKGAVFLHIHPRSWIPRMSAHALRQWKVWREGRGISPASYVINWLKGVAKARRLNVF